MATAQNHGDGAPAFVHTLRRSVGSLVWGGVHSIQGRSVHADGCTDAVLIGAWSCRPVRDGGASHVGARLRGKPCGERPHCQKQALGGSGSICENAFLLAVPDACNMHMKLWHNATTDGGARPFSASGL